MTIRVRLSVLVAASAFALVGCGGGSSDDEGVADLSATKILAAAEKQVTQEKFVTIKGKAKESGTEVAVDLSYVGEDAAGSIGIDDMSIEVVKADGKSYFKAGREFFESSGAPAEAVKLIGDKWVAIDANNPSFAEMGNFLSKKTFIDEILKADGKVTKGKEKKVDGVDCVALKAKDGTFYFDKKDGRPVRLVSTGDGAGTLDFSYSKVETVEAPSSDEIIDLAKLGQ